MQLSKHDQEVLNFAIKKSQLVSENKKNRVSTVIKTHSGQLITASNMEGTFGCIDTCAEQIALGKAISEGNNDISLVVTVRHPRAEDAVSSFLTMLLKRLSLFEKAQLS